MPELAPSQQEDYLTPAEEAGIYLAVGDGNRPLGEAVAREMGIALGSLEVKWHGDGEPFARIDETITKKTAILMQSHYSANGLSPSDLFMQHLGMIKSAAARDPAAMIVASPYTFGARSEKEEERSEAAYAVVALDSLKDVARADGVKRTLVTVDHHAPSRLTNYDPAYNISVQSLIIEAFREKIVGEREDYVLLSPDKGHTKQNSKNAKSLGLEVVDLEKVRDANDSTKIWRPKSRIQKLKGKKVFVLDDMVGSANTAVSAAEVAEASGAAELYLGATHLVLPDGAIDRLDKSPFNEVFGTNTIDVAWAERELQKLTVLHVEKMLAKAFIRMITGRGSVSEVSAGSNGR